MNTTNIFHAEAYAKINVYLEVAGRRSDGYHNILAHMQAVTLHDTLSFEWRGCSEREFVVRLTCSNTNLSCDETNLVCRAVRALSDKMCARGIPPRGTLDIHLEKRIPMAAGLAGGSADAAAALRGMNALLGQPFSVEELCDVAAGLGADVPFCVRCVEHGAMTARGIGEVLSPAPDLPADTVLVIACHGEGVSTPWAYRKLDEQGTADAARMEEAYEKLQDALAQGDLGTIASYSRNCFESIVLPERTAVPLLMREMQDSGAVFARMSGSGPSVVGYFENEATAAHCVAHLAVRGITAHLCRPLSCPAK